MINLRNERGSITLFVLISCMFFIASVACVQMYMQSKKIAVDREYRQIKSNYEGNTLDENNLKENYEQLSKIKNIGINIVKATWLNNNLNVEFTLTDTDVNIKTIKYGWGTAESVDTVPKWTFVENDSPSGSKFALNSSAINNGDYHLFIVVNDNVIYNKITV